MAYQPQVKAIEYAPYKSGGKNPFPVPDIYLPYSECYNGNVLIKKAEAKTELTQAHLDEIYKCASDPVYFIENYCRIISLDDGIVSFKLFPFQKDMIRNFQAERFTLSLLARQSGKTQVVAGYIAWFAIFNPTEQIAILANKADAAQEVMDRIRFMLENLPFFLQPGVKIYNRRTIVLDTDTKIFSSATGGSGIRGRSCSLVYIDEACFIEKDMEFYESTYPVLSSGQKTRMIMTSTPRGARGMFYMLWRDALEGKNSYKTYQADWTARPERDIRWRNETVANIGYSRFKQEYENSWVGSTGTLIPMKVLETLQWINPINDDESLCVYRKYDPSHKYITVADPSEGTGNDYSVITVIDITEYPHRIAAKYRNNDISPLLLPHTILNMCMEYGNCPVLVESNSACGGQVTYILYYELEYENVILTSNNEKSIGGLREGGKGNQAMPGVRTSKKVKSIGCSNLKTLMENNYLLVDDRDTIEELGTFIAKGTSYEADDECHDDTITPLILYSWFIKSEYFTEYCGSDIGVDLYAKNMKKEMDNVMPFGVINRGFDTQENHYRAYSLSGSYEVTENLYKSFQEWMME